MNRFPHQKKYVVSLLLCMGFISSPSAQESTAPLLWGSSYGAVNFIPSMTVAGELEKTGNGKSIGLYPDSTGVVRNYSYNNEKADLQPKPEGTEDFDTILAMSEGSRRENLLTSAGSFPDCFVLTESNENESFTWWFTTDASVPGCLVQYQNEDEDGTMTAQLEKIIKNQNEHFLLKN